MIILGAIGWGVYAYLEIRRENLNLRQSLESFRENLAQVEAKNARLAESLRLALGDVDTFASQVEELSGTVKKLSELDPELLKKYSKVYFLSENYVPRGLTEINPVYLYRSTKPQQILALTYPYLWRLMEASIEDGLTLRIISAYRSFGTQGSLKNSYKVTYGAGTANQFSAEQGYSEHQLGTAVDFTNPTVGETFSGFSKTAEYKWLTENAYKYGFVLSYPENNTYYVYEPWHWRFVGVALARRLQEEKQYFYSLEQRQLDPYLLNIFD